MKQKRTKFSDRSPDAKLEYAKALMLYSNSIMLLMFTTFFGSAFTVLIKADVTYLQIWQFLVRFSKIEFIVAIFLLIAFSFSRYLQNIAFDIFDEIEKSNHKCS